MSNVTGFHHIALNAANFDKSVEFYKSLGLTEYVRWGEDENRAVMLDMGDGGKLEIFAKGEAREKIDERFLHLAFCADDIDGIYEKVIASGAVSKYAPYDVSPENAVPSIKMRVAFVYGPDGELLEFFKEI